MDRHSIPGATVDDAAANHARDLTVSVKHGVRFLSGSVDAANDGVFCLVHAPYPERLEAVHREAHGLIPNEIISVSEDDVLRVLNRIHDSADSTEVTNPFRTILFTDLEGSTALTEEVGVSVYMLLLTEHDLIIRRARVGWRGREVKHTGDGILSSFDDVSNALECALVVLFRSGSLSLSNENRPATGWLLSMLVQPSAPA